MKKFASLTIAMLFLFAVTKTYGGEYPRQLGYVNDFGGVLNEYKRATLNYDLEKFYQETAIKIFVVTVNDLGGQKVESYTSNLRQAWNLDDQSNSIILFVALADRKIRISTNSASSLVLNEQEAEMIINKNISPRLRTGDMTGGIIDGTGTLKAVLKSNLSIVSAEIDWFPIIMYTVLGLILVAWLISMIRRKMKASENEDDSDYYESIGTSEYSEDRPKSTHTRRSSYSSGHQVVDNQLGSGVDTTAAYIALSNMQSNSDNNFNSPPSHSDYTPSHNSGFTRSDDGPSTTNTDSGYTSGFDSGGISSDTGASGDW